jgi:stage V sporulation protein SpoVS
MGSARRPRAGGTPAASGAPVHPEAQQARDALDAVLSRQRALPQGLGFFLKVAEVTEAGPDGVVLALPPGPGLERLSSDAQARAAVAAALAGELGHDVALEIRAIGAAAGSAASPSAARLTPERVKADQLARLVRDQPVLGQAVRDWDLELE